MDKSEYFVLAVLAVAASATAVNALRPRTFVLHGVSVRISEPEMAERRVVRDMAHRTLFSVNCELGGRVVSIDYSSRVEE